jgi:hypothetical protein
MQDRGYEFPRRTPLGNLVNRGNLPPLGASPSPDTTWAALDTPVVVFQSHLKRPSTQRSAFRGPIPTHPS